MKKMIMGLVLCLGLSQIATATGSETKGIMAWIKANPKTAVIATAAACEALGLAGCMVYDGFKSKEEGLVAKTKGGFFAGASRFGRAHKAVAWDYTTSKVVTLWWNNKKYSIPATVLVAIVAAVVADYATTDEEAQTKMAQAWNGLFGSKKEQKTVVA